MENTLSNSEYHQPGLSPLDEDDFIPIDHNWQKKYYKKAFWKRVIAAVLDFFIMSILVYIIAVIFLSIIAIVSIVSNPTDKIMDDCFTLIISNLIFFSSYFVIYAIMESSKWKGTFGKRIMKIEVSDDYGNAISFWRSIERNFLKLIASYSYIFIIPLIIQIFTYRKSGKLFHDYFSKTTIGERISGQRV